MRRSFDHFACGLWAILSPWLCVSERKMLNLRVFPQQEFYALFTSFPRRDPCARAGFRSRAEKGKIIKTGPRMARIVAVQRRKDAVVLCE